MVQGNATLTKIVTLIIDPAVLLIFSVGFLLFVWGLVEFIYDPADSGKRENGKRHMIWGIIGMFIMISTAGIISIIDDTFDLGIRNNQFGVPSSGIQTDQSPSFFGDRQFQLQ